MILVDYSGSMFSALHVELAKNPGTACGISFLRHCLLNQLRSYSRKFHEEYGEMTVCLEGGSCWRKDVFPNYKAQRAKSRIDSGLDWEQIFRDMNQITEELQEVMPWKFIRVKGLEADDVIAILARNAASLSGSDVFGEPSPVMIVSNDKDYAQLQEYPWVRQYLPRKGTTVVERKPRAALLDLIVHGDKADGIPNINSDIDTFADGGRQRPITRELMSDILARGGKALDESQKKRFRENETLISFDKIPEEYTDKVISAWKECSPSRNRMKLFEYLAKTGLSKQLDRACDFFPS